MPLHFLPWTALNSRAAAEEQDVAVEILELEATQAIVGVLERHGERDMARRDLYRQRVRIRDVQIGVPSGAAVSGRVRQRLDADIP